MHDFGSPCTQFLRSSRQSCILRAIAKFSKSIFEKRWAKTCNVSFLKDHSKSKEADCRLAETVEMLNSWFFSTLFCLEDFTSCLGLLHFAPAAPCLFFLSLFWLLSCSSVSLVPGRLCLSCLHAPSCDVGQEEQMVNISKFSRETNKKFPN